METAGPLEINNLKKIYACIARYLFLHKSISKYLRTKKSIPSHTVSQSQTPKLYSEGM